MKEKPTNMPFKKDMDKPPSAMECFAYTCDRLRSLQESPAKHPILRTSAEAFCPALEAYTASDFAKVKDEVTRHFDREMALAYAEKYSYLYDFIQKRYPSTDYEVSETGKMNDLRQLIFKIVFNKMLEINDDYYYILFEYYPALYEWGREFAWKFSEPVTLMMVYQKTSGGM